MFYPFLCIGLQDGVVQTECCQFSKSCTRLGDVADNAEAQQTENARGLLILFPIVLISP